MKKINFSNPLNGRKWLSLLESDLEFGMLFKKNLFYSKDFLGFSFKSNKFGLRGPENINAKSVICGTSFAMGLSVDNGENWYELDKKYQSLFNIGMPIGFKYQLNLLKKYYHGSADTLIFLYHPNIWITNKSFYIAEKRGIDIFTSMKWSTSTIKISYLYIRWLIKERVKTILNKKTIVAFDHKKYHLNLNYSYFSSTNTSDIEQILYDFKELTKEFNKVIVFKIPIKEELGLKYSNNSNLKLLNNNYKEMWNIFLSSLDNKTKVIDLSNKFILSDYLEEDTHWSKSGNKKFHQYILENTRIL